MTQLDAAWEKMKQTDGIIIQKRFDGIETIKDIHNRFFYVKCKAKHVQLNKSEEE